MRLNDCVEINAPNQVRSLYPDPVENPGSSAGHIGMYLQYKLYAGDHEKFPYWKVRVQLELRNAMYRKSQHYNILSEFRWIPSPI